MATRLSSASNEHVRGLLRLDKRAERDSVQRTVVEGAREVRRTLAAGVEPVEAYYCPERTASADADVVERLLELDRERRTHLFEVTPELFARIAVREGSGGIVLVIPYQPLSLTELPLLDCPLYVVIEGVEKPGNLGAILRSADAAGVDAVIVTDGVTDTHNPNVIRASLGTRFALPVCEASTSECLAWLHEGRVRVLAATPDGESLYSSCDMTGAVAIFLGSEAHGLSDAVRSAADPRVYLPMHGFADSLNLATSAAILMYEALRQRTLAARGAVL